jgi:hypothetical protein
MAEFDVKQVSTYEWLGIGAGGAALINSFLPWFSAGEGVFSYSANAWNLGFLSVVSVLVLIAAGVIVLLPHLGTQIQNRSLIWLGLAGLALLFTIIVFLINVFDDGVSISVGILLGLAAAVASGAGAFLTYKQTAPKTT